MAVELSTVADPYLPEPKGASTALAGTVYVSDGLGSGDWLDISTSLSNEVIVSALSDLPTPSGGVITLADSTIYTFTGDVDIGVNVLDLSGENILIRGTSSVNDIITSSTTNYLINSTGYTLRIKDVGLSVPNGSLFYTNKDVSTTARVLIENVYSASFVNIGDINGSIGGKISGCYFSGGSGNLNFYDSNAMFEISNNYIAYYSGYGINLGTATFTVLTIDTNIIIPLSAIGLSGASSSGNIIGIGKITENTFLGSGTFVSGIVVESDLRWKSYNNYQVADSISSIGMSFYGNATSTTISATSSDGTNAVKMNTGGLATSYEEYKFSIATDGTITYNGIDDKEALIIYNIYNDVDGGTNQVLNFYIAINGVIKTESRSTASFDSANPASVTVIFNSKISTNDTIDLYIENTTAVNSTTVIGATGIIR